MDITVFIDKARVAGFVIARERLEVRTAEAFLGIPQSRERPRRQWQLARDRADIAGRDVANPLAAILSGAMLLEHSLGAAQAAEAVREAVAAVLEEGVRTRDLVLEGEERPVLGCRAVGDRVLELLDVGSRS